MIIDLFLASVSALLLLLIFPGFDLHYLAWFALVPLLLVVKRGGPGRAFLASLLAGFIFFICLLLWNLHVAGSNLINFSLSMFGQACYIGVFGLLAHYFQRRLPQWNALIFPTIWVLLEFLRTHMFFLSWPWGVLGYSQYQVLPVARVSAFTGVYGVSFLIVVCNTIIADILQARISFQPVGREFRTPGTISALVLIVTAISFSLFTSAQARENSANLQAAVIQGGIYWFESKDEELKKQVFARYQELTLDAAEAQPEIIIWPSSTVPGWIPSDVALVKSLADLSRESGAYLLVGSAGFDKLSSKKDHEKRASNSAFLFSPRGRIVGQYDKIRLLPFDEYLPLRKYIKWPDWIVSDMSDSRPGDRLTVFNMGRAKFCVLICWENYFPDQFRKMAAQNVDFMVTMTNDAFVDVPAANYQMLAMNIFRAIENHVSVIRVSTSGVSGVIDPSGRILATVHDENGKEVDIIGQITGQVPLSSKRSFYNRHGDWFIISLAAGLLLFLVLSLRNMGIRSND